MSDEIALPRWESFAHVSADQIAEVLEGSELVLFRWQLACGLIVDVHPWLAGRVAPNTPPTGGYYIRFDNGFETWMPTEEFDAVYRRVATEA